MPDPFAQVASPVQNADPFAGVASAAPSASPADWQKQVKPIDLGGGKQSVQRSDGGVWFGPEQGNKGKAGWFDAKGNRLPDAPVDESQYLGLSGRVKPDMDDYHLLTVSLGYSPDKAHEIMSAPGYKQGMFQNAVTDPNSFAAAMGHTVLGSIYKGALGDPSAALGQLASHLGVAAGVNDPRNAELRDAMVKLGHANYQQNWKGNTSFDAATGQGSKTSAADFVGQMIGNALPFIATEGKNPATIGAKLLSKEALPALGKMALQGAAYGELQPVTQGDNFGEQKLEQAALGAAGGVGGGVLGEKVISPLVSKVGGKVAAVAQGRMTPLAQELQDLSNKYGVRLSVGDITQGPFAKKAETAMESVPVVGMAGFREAQQKEAAAAAQKLLEQHGIPGDAATTIQQGLKNNLAKGKAAAAQAYDQVGQLAGDKPVLLNETIDKINKALQSEESAVAPDTGLINILNSAKQRLQSPEVDTSFQGIRKFRSDLGGKIADYYKGTNAATGSQGVQVLKGIKDAVENDLNKFAETNGPEIAQAAKKADSIYKNQVVPYKDAVIAKAVKSSEPDQIYKAIIGAGKDRAQKFYDTLDPDGQAAVRSQMVKNAFDGAQNPNGTFSPAKFAQALEKIKDQTGVFFKGQDKWELDGITKLMRHAERAGQFAENPPTGNRLLPLLMGGGAALHPEAGGVAAASALGLKTLFTTNAGKRLLLAASDAQPGSKAMDNVLTKITTLLGAKSGAGGVSPMSFLPSLAQNGQSANQVAMTVPQ